MEHTREIHIQHAIDFYWEMFAHKPEEVVFAPGRVNLIGEHTDYHEGFVLSFALPYGTVIAASTLPIGSLSRVVSKEFAKEEVQFKIDPDLLPSYSSWANYIIRIIRLYLSDLPIGAAFEATISSNVPLGGGLSSSASLE